jgi:hypothetical protein
MLLKLSSSMLEASRPPRFSAGKAALNQVLHSRRGGSTAPRHQVVHPRWLGDGLRLRNFIGREPLSTLLSFLGGNAWRTPASGGGSTQGLDCLEFLCSRVFSQNFNHSNIKKKKGS